MTTKKPVHRNRLLFHTVGGHVDFSRLVEQSIPTLVMGVIVIYANSLVSGAQIINLKEQVEKGEAARIAIFTQLQATNVELAKLNAQVVAFLGQQNSLNAAMDARLTYIERAQNTGRVTVINPPQQRNSK